MYASVDVRLEVVLACAEGHRSCALITSKSLWRALSVLCAAPRGAAVATAARFIRHALAAAPAAAAVRVAEYDLLAPLLRHHLALAPFLDTS